jgi:hypothetical protein
MHTPPTPEWSECRRDALRPATVSSGAASQRPETTLTATEPPAIARPVMPLILALLVLVVWLESASGSDGAAWDYAAQLEQVPRGGLAVW